MLSPKTTLGVSLMRSLSIDFTGFYVCFILYKDDAILLLHCVLYSKTTSIKLIQTDRISLITHTHKPGKIKLKLLIRMSPNVVFVEIN